MSGYLQVEEAKASTKVELYRDPGYSISNVYLGIV
jgi:hypothetical protein